MKTNTKKFFALALSSCMMLSMLAACDNGGSGDGPVVSGDVYTLTLNYNDEGSRPRAVEVAKGESAKTPAEPLRTGYSFAGWYTSQNGGDEVKFPYTLSSNTQIYAHWKPGVYNVTFDYNYDGAPDSVVQQIEYKSEVNAPSNIPERKGYVFRSWSTKSDVVNAVSFPYTVTKDATFYATWRDADTKVYTVTVNYGDYAGAPAPLVYEIEDGNALEKSQAPTEKRTGYSLEGWSTTPDGKNPVELPYTPTKDTALYAIWGEQTYKLSLRYNFTDAPGTFYKQIECKASEPVAEPEAPQREGYIFDGWYTTALGGKKVEFPLKVAKAAAYFAHWKSVPVTTDVFHAEYVSFDPDQKYPGYSGEAQGSGCMVPADVSGVKVDNYPMNSKRPKETGFYVSYQYMRGAVLTFEITASEDINGATLIANWATELATGGLTFGPTGSCAYVIKVNGTPLNYTPANVTGANEGTGQYKCGFKEYTLGTINLKKGVNTITMEPDNDSGSLMGGTVKSVGPMTDYIRIDYGASGKLSWQPVYDNLDNK